MHTEYAVHFLATFSNERVLSSEYTGKCCSLLAACTDRLIDRSTSHERVNVYSCMPNFVNFYHFAIILTIIIFECIDLCRQAGHIRKGTTHCNEKSSSPICFG